MVKCCLNDINGREKVNQLHSIISNRDMNLSARRWLLLSAIRPSKFEKVIRVRLMLYTGKIRRVYGIRSSGKSTPPKR